MTREELRKRLAKRICCPVACEKTFGSDQSPFSICPAHTWTIEADACLAELDAAGLLSNRVANVTE